MRIGFIDADITWRKQPKDPDKKVVRKANTPLAQIMGEARRAGHTVEWFETMGGHYDKVFISKSLISTPDYSREVIDADKVAFLGSGWKRKRKDTAVRCSHPKAEHIDEARLLGINPDYSLYPENLRP